MSLSSDCFRFRILRSKHTRKSKALSIRITHKRSLFSQLFVNSGKLFNMIFDMMCLEPQQLSVASFTASQHSNTKHITLPPSATVFLVSPPSSSPCIQAQSLSLADTTIIYRIYISLLFILKLFITKCTLGNKKIQTTVVNKNIQVI